MSMRELIKEIPKWFLVLWIAGLVTSLTLVGVVIWGIIRLVGHFTGA